MTESIQILMEKDRLQPLADNIKVLKGSDSITLQQMEDTIEETNTDITSQTDLIAQLTSALQGKSVPSGGASVETCTVTVTFTSAYWLAFSYTAFEDGGITHVVRSDLSGGSNETIVMENVVCGAPIVVQTNLTFMGATLPNGVEKPFNTRGVYYFVATVSGANATINIYNND